MLRAVPTARLLLATIVRSTNTTASTPLTINNRTNVTRRMIRCHFNDLLLLLVESIGRAVSDDTGTKAVLFDGCITSDGVGSGVKAVSETDIGSLIEGRCTLLS